MNPLFNALGPLQIAPLTNRTIGQNVLQEHNIPNGDYWYWIGVGGLLAYALLFNCTVTLALTYLNRKFERNLYVCISSSPVNAFSL